MSLRGKELICVWELIEANDDADVDLTWRLRQMVNQYVGTRDELRYFRVINEHGKHFFDSPAEYLAFSGADPKDHQNFPGLSEIISAWEKRVASGSE